MASLRINVLLVTTERRTGAFITTLDLVDGLRERGHEVTVNGDTPCDLTISHLGDRRAKYVTKRHFLMVHGANVRYRRHLPRHDKLWFPSRALHRWYGAPDKSVILPPAIDPYRYLVDPGEHVTLAAVSPAKGSSRLRWFAEKLPHIPFLAVAENPPKPDPVLEALPNVTTMPRAEDIREVLERTKVLIMPLGGQSWGRTAVEASVSGIPTIATTLPGVREAMAEGATYVSTSFLGRWVAAIDRIYGEGYQKASEAAQRRGDALDFEEDMRRLCEAVESP